MRDLAAEEELQRSLLKLSTTHRKSILVATGHGERSIQGADAYGMFQLGQALAGDGFDIAEWNPLENGPIGDDVDLLFIAAPTDAFSEDEVAMERAFVDRGGRLLVIGGKTFFEGPGSTGDLLAPYGILPRRGIVAAPTFSQDLGGVTVGFPKCGDFFVREAGLNSTHDITRPLWQAAMRVRVVHSRAFERGVAPSGGSLQALLTQNDRGTWLDLPRSPRGEYAADGLHNWSLDAGREKNGSMAVAMAAEFPAGLPVESAEDLPLDDARRRSRVVGIAMPEMASNGIFQAGSTGNRDFLLNCFNWLAEREFSLRVAMRRDAPTTLDLNRGTEIILLRRVAWWGLPGLLALVGGLLAWRRRG